MSHHLSDEMESRSLVLTRAPSIHHFPTGRFRKNERFESFRKIQKLFKICRKVCPSKRNRFDHLECHGAIVSDGARRWCPDQIHAWVGFLIFNQLQNAVFLSVGCDVQ